MILPACPVEVYIMLAEGKLDVFGTTKIPKVRR
jgi:hypothetical protein